ncbi:hypothetical protein CALCODRAFT_98575 [Calocera cornea HHB12733]|uniref:CsbD-like domain-containing protein n=1 Tax=Calocera cornea HHB12733 TaxID=1353952 RepID=A0A165D7K4_9BASI|nr:hypothetical protein CALCODRAFT_98575 [Calocera cornea HHB12733]
MSSSDSGPRESASLADPPYEPPANLTDSIKSGFNQASHAASNFFSTASGASNPPSHTEGKTDSYLGSVKQSVGKAFGDSTLTGAGQGQHAAGQAQDEAATLAGYVKEHVSGASAYLSNAASSLTSGLGSGNYVSSEPSKLDAGVDKTVGDARARVGEALGAQGVKAAGDAQYARGEGQDIMARVRENLASTADQMQGRDPVLGEGKPDPWRAE